MLKTTWKRCSMCDWIKGFSERGNLKSKWLLCWSPVKRRNKMMWAMPVPRKGTERAARFIDKLGHNRVTLRCDNEPAIKALAREIGQARQEGSQTVPDTPPVGESQSNGIIERAVGLVAGQARVPLAGGICCVPDEQV